MWKFGERGGSAAVTANIAADISSALSPPSYSSSSSSSSAAAAAAASAAAIKSGQNFAASPLHHHSSPPPPSPHSLHSPHSPYSPPPFKHSTRGPSNAHEAFSAAATKSKHTSPVLAPAAPSSSSRTPPSAASAIVRTYEQEVVEPVVVPTILGHAPVRIDATFILLHHTHQLVFLCVTIACATHLLYNHHASQRHPHTATQPCNFQSFIAVGAISFALPPITSFMLLKHEISCSRLR
jgi:hypothetical protein